VATIPAELLPAIAEAGEHPLRLVHPQTDRVYLLVPDPRKDNETDAEDVSSMEYLIDELDPEDWVDASRYGL
jgi:hypothetical protein